MRTIFWGLFLAWIHFTVNLNGAPVELLPACIGWYVVLKGVRELPPCAERDGLENPLKVLTALTAVTWCLNTIGLRDVLGVVSGAFGMLVMCAELYVVWLLVKLMGALEKIVSHSLRSAPLYTLWQASAVCTVVAYGMSLTTFLPVVGGVAAMMFGVAALAAFVITIAMLYQFWQAVKGYEEALAHPVELLPPGDPED